jgi:hypothetical protein
MKPNLKKFSLYLEIDGLVDYSIVPNFYDTEKKGDEIVYNFLIDVNKSNTFKIKLEKQKTSNATIKIKKIILNNVELVIFKSFGVFINESKQKKAGKTLLDEPGEFIMRVHGNVISHNFMNYIMSLTNTAI